MSATEEKKDKHKRVKRDTDAHGNPTSGGDNEAELLHFDVKDVETLEANWSRRANLDTDVLDILLTNQWPKYVEKLCNQKLDDAAAVDSNTNSDRFGSELCAHLAMRLKPRYHFAATQNIFFERVPYRNHQVLVEKDQNTTRFLGLAKCNAKNKPKYLYAFNMTPAKRLTYRELIDQAAHSTQPTECPYRGRLSVSSELAENSKKDGGDGDQPSLQYFYDAEHIKKMSEASEKKMLEKRRRMEASQSKEQEPCWFCLGVTKVERHFIVSVSDKCYLAYAKGALNADHLLIIPIDHVQSSVHADSALLDDIGKYKRSLVDYFAAMRKCVVFFERNFRTKHMQIHAIAIRADKVYLLRDAFVGAAKEQDIHLNEIPEMTNLKQVLRSHQSFYYLELPDEDGPNHVRYLNEIRGHHFPLNFGRLVFIQV